MSERIYFGKIKEAVEPPNLIEVQLNSYVEFLQKDVPPSKRKNVGLQAVFKEVFPIQSYDDKPLALLCMSLSS
jgi:DNA-directed RNA polymerase subunit beta